jgi:hypothetical protein
VKRILTLTFTVSLAIGLSGVCGGSASAACTAPQWATPAVATAAWSNVPGLKPNEKWLAGDGGWTTVHPVTCARLHVFGDSAVINGAGTRVMPQGNAILQTAGGLRMISGATSMIPTSPDGSVDWPGPMLLEGNRLFTFTSHIKTTPGVEGWEDRGKDLAEFYWGGSTLLQYKGKWITPSTGRAGHIQKPDGTWTYNTMWGAAAITHLGYHYIYGTYSERGWFGNRVYVARVPVGQLTNATAWRYWAGSSWSAQEADVSAVISEFGGTESSFSVYTHNGEWRIVSKRDGTFGDTVVKWHLRTPGGPWTTMSEEFRAPWVETDQTYLVTAHGDMAYSNGQVPVTISHGRGSSGSLGDMWERPERYRNTWHSVAR